MATTNKVIIEAYKAENGLAFRYASLHLDSME